MKQPRICSTHDGEELFDPCAGGGVRSRGYCSKWDGTLIGAKETQPGASVGGWPDCVFEEEQ